MIEKGQLLRRPCGGDRDDDGAAAHDDDAWDALPDSYVHTVQLAGHVSRPAPHHQGDPFYRLLDSVF